MVDKIRQELDNDKERRDNDDGEDNDDNEDDDNETVSGDNMFVCLFVCGAWLYSQIFKPVSPSFVCFVPVSERHTYPRTDSRSAPVYEWREVR